MYGVNLEKIGSHYSDARADNRHFLNSFLSSWNRKLNFHLKLKTNLLYNQQGTFSKL